MSIPTSGGCSAKRLKRPAGSSKPIPVLASPGSWYHLQTFSSSLMVSRRNYDKHMLASSPPLDHIGGCRGVVSVIEV